MDPAPTANPASPVLLLVEDEQSLLRAFAHAFERSGYTVLTAIDVPSAMRHWEANRDRISMVVSDVQMPGPLIEELIAAVGTRVPRPPILLMSGELRGTEQRIKQLMSSVDGFLAKPLRIDALRAEVERHIGARPRP
ncbi:MAG: response regulator [Gemmatimonadetes bacterium]|nr:response regulator [Gemmatimonadota bacterium]